MNVQDDDEKELFRRAMQDVRPLKRPQRVVGGRRPPRAHATFARAERAAVLSESLLAPGPFIDAQPGDELLYRREGVPESILRGMRRGHYRVEAELDLHGLRAQEAVLQLAQFLQRVRVRGLQCVRIIHGKGLRSGQRGPVLKQAVNTVLRRAEAVLAFTSAPPRSGGTGATLVLLRRAARL